MKKRLTTKSREASRDLFRGSASSPYNKIGTHLVRFVSMQRFSSERCPPVNVLHYAMMISWSMS